MAVCSAIADDLSKPVPWTALDFLATQGMASIFAAIGFDVIPDSFNIFAVRASAIPEDSSLRPFHKSVFTKHGPTKRFAEVFAVEDLESDTLTALDYVRGNPSAWRQFVRRLGDSHLLDSLQRSFHSLFTRAVALRC